MTHQVAKPGRSRGVYDCLVCVVLAVIQRWRLDSALPSVATICTSRLFFCKPMLAKRLILRNACSASVHLAVHLVVNPSGWCSRVWAVGVTSTAVLSEWSRPFSEGCIPMSHCLAFSAMEKLDMTFLWQPMIGVPWVADHQPVQVMEMTVLCHRSIILSRLSLSFCVFTPNCSATWNLLYKPLAYNSVFTSLFLLVGYLLFAVISYRLTHRGPIHSVMYNCCPVSMCTPISHMLPCAHPSPYQTRHLDRFSHFCKAHDRERQTDRQTSRYSICNSIHSRPNVRA